jgi:predicted protein tyrosine phosphatase
MNNQKLQKVMFVGRATAETTYGWDNWAIISITEPATHHTEANEAKLMDGWQLVHRSAFFDLVEERWPYSLMTYEDAFQIVNFVNKNAKKVEGIMVHCKAGISRSAAVAKWISLVYDLPFNHEYEHYNWHVYKLLNNMHDVLESRRLGVEILEKTMILNGRMGFKHMMHNTNDLCVDYEIDLIAKIMLLKVDAIDTLSMQDLENDFVGIINRYLDEIGTKQQVKNLDKFNITLVLEGKKTTAKFNLRIVKRDFEPALPTLVMKLIEENEED